MSMHTYHFLWRLADSKYENEQTGGEQLPDEEDRPEHQVPSISQLTAQVSLSHGNNRYDNRNHYTGQHRYDHQTHYTGPAQI